MADGHDITPAPVALTRKGECYAEAAQGAPGTPQDAAPLPNVRETLLARQRAAVERLEALAALIVEKLDELGVDADLEPVLGAPELSPFWTTATFREGFDQTHWGEEGDADEREASDDAEPSLGSLGSCFTADHANQRRWAPDGVDSFDLEEQCEDEGHDSDSEPDHGDM